MLIDADWLGGVLAGSEGMPAVYTRAGAGSIPVTVVAGRMRPERQAIADGRANLEIEPADFLVRAGDIDFGAGPVEPRTGDRVTLAGGRVYELMPRDGEPSFRALGQHPLRDAAGSVVARGPMYRLRTIRVRVVP